ncbi:methyltransferase domain-containing protein [Candidatus Woesearchaeota archaeon]|nr:methyltransferase domain-containing protein [Candidatus Woesearchaeota archaeon]
MNSKLNFLANYLKKPKEVAAILPSSKFVIGRIKRLIDFEKADCIVEFGPGTGSVSKMLLSNMKSNAKLLCFETNNRFCSYLRQNFSDKRITIINDSAENLDIHLKKLDAGSVDYFISSIPFTFLDKKAKTMILKKVSSELKPGKRLIVSQQYNLHLKKYLLDYFDKVIVDIELRNIPPSFIYVCDKA